MTPLAMLALNAAAALVPFLAAHGGAVVSHIGDTRMPRALSSCAWRVASLAGPALASSAFDLATRWAGAPSHGVLAEAPGRPAPPGPADGSDARRDDDADDGDEGASREDPPDEQGGSAGRDGLRRSAAPSISIGGADVHVPAGEYHPGDIVSIGDKVTIEGEVRGNVVVIGGTLVVSGTVRGDIAVVVGVASIAGTVRGDLASVASRLTLEPQAFIRGSCVNIMGKVSKAPGATIGREFQSIGFLNLGWFASGRGPLPFLAFLFFWVAIIGTAIRFLGVLVVSALAPSNIEGALAQPRPSLIVAFFVGLLVNVLAALVSIGLILLCVTLPVAIVLGLAVRVLKWMGLSSICLLAGRWVSRTIAGREFSYFGSILTGFLLFAAIGFVPILGWIATGVLSVTGLGLMVLTRFGRGPRKRKAAPSAPPPAAHAAASPSPSAP